MGWNGGVGGKDGGALGGERILIALGGNAMTAPDGSATPQAQAAAIERAMGLARRLDATTLVIATDVESAMTGYGTPRERPLHRTTVAELGELAAAGHFAGGSMGPKVEAVRRFVAAGGRRAAIASLAKLGDAAHGRPERSSRPDPG